MYLPARRYRVDGSMLYSCFLSIIILATNGRFRVYKREDKQIIRGKKKKKGQRISYVPNNFAIVVVLSSDIGISLSKKSYA